MILVAALFFKEQAITWFQRKFGLESDQKNDPDTPKWARELKEHYNDETTELLRKLVEKSEGQCKKLDTIIRYHQDTKEDDEEWRRESRETMRDILRRT